MYEERRQKREQLARHIMNEIKAWMEYEGVKYSGESLTGKAVTYAYNCWGNMMRYLEDGSANILWVLSTSKKAYPIMCSGFPYLHLVRRSQLPFGANTPMPFIE